jgi:hypothetical protein
VFIRGELTDQWIAASNQTVQLTSTIFGTLPLVLAVLLPLFQDMFDGFFHSCFPVLFVVPQLKYRKAATGIMLVNFTQSLYY